MNKQWSICQPWNYGVIGYSCCLYTYKLKRKFCLPCEYTSHIGTKLMLFFHYSWSWWWIYRLCSNPLVPGTRTAGRGYAIWSTGWCLGHRMCVCWTSNRSGIMAGKIRRRSTVFNKKDFRYILLHTRFFLLNNFIYSFCAWIIESFHNGHR